MISIRGGTAGEVASCRAYPVLSEDRTGTRKDVVTTVAATRLGPCFAGSGVPAMINEASSCINELFPLGLT